MGKGTSCWHVTVTQSSDNDALVYQLLLLFRRIIFSSFESSQIFFLGAQYIFQKNYVNDLKIHLLKS